MKRHFFKKALAILCTITLLPLGSFYSSAQEPVTVDELEGFTELTLLDAGITDCVNQQRDGYNSLNVETLDNTLFSVRLAYQAANGSRFHYGVNNSEIYSGISFRLETAEGKEVLTVGNEVGSSGITNLPWSLATLDSVTAGVGETFVNTEFLLQISTQFVDHDGGGTDNDIKLGIFINGKLYDNQYCYINDSADQLGTNINFNAGAAALLGSYTRNSGGEYEKWTYGEMSDASLDGSMFSAMANFISGNLWIGSDVGFVFAAEGGTTGTGLKLYLVDGGYPLAYPLTDEKAGCQLRNNGNLKISMAVEKVGTKGTKLSVYFNDVMYGGSPIYVAKTPGLQRKAGVSSSQVTVTAVHFDESIPVPTDLTELTLLDAGITDCVNQQKDGYNSLNVETLDNTLFSVRLAYQAANGSRFHYGVNNTNSYSGISFRLEMADGKEVLTVGNEVGSSGITSLPWTLVALDPKTAGVGNTFVNKEFLLQISTKFVDHDNGGTKNDIKLGIFINGKPYNNQYYYIDNGADQLGTNINFNAGAAALLGSYTRDSGTEYEKWTTGEESASSLTGSSFSAMANFTSGNLWIGNGDGDGFVFAAEGGAAGTGLMLYLMNNGDYPLMYPLTDEKAGCQLRGNSDLKLTMDTEMVGTKGTKLSIYFNDVLYGGSAIYVAKMPELRRNTVVSGQIQLTPISSSQPGESMSIDELVGYEFLTLRDAGIADAENSVFNGSFSRESMDKTVVSMKLAYKGNGGRLHIGKNDHDYGGLAVRLEDGNLIVGNEMPGTTGDGFLNNCPWQLVRVDPKKAGVGDTFLDTRFILQISIAFVDLDSDGKKNDIELGIFINGFLYDNQFCYIKDNGEQFGTGINFNENTADYESYPDQPEKPLDIGFLMDYDFLTLSDAGIVNGTGPFKGEFSRESLDRTVISAKLAYKNNIARLHIGNGENDYGGLAFRLENGDLIVGNEMPGQTGDGFLNNCPWVLAQIDPLSIGVGSTFANMEFLLQVSIAFVDHDLDGKKNDIELGIFINGTLYNNMFLYIKDNAEQFKTGINFNEGTADHTSFNDIHDLKDITAADFGLVNAVISNERKVKSDGGMLAGTALTMKMKFPREQGNSMYIGGNENGLKLESRGDGTIKMSYVETGKEAVALTTLTPQKAKVASFSNKSLKWRFEFSKQELSGMKQLVIGIYIEDVLYEYQYITLKSINPDSLQRVLGIHATTGSFEITAPEYEELTFHDFSITDKEYIAPKEEGYRENYRNWDIMDETAVTGIVNFGAVRAGRIQYGASDWYGLILTPENEDAINVFYVQEGAADKMLACLRPEKAGVKSFIGEDVEIRVTFDMLKVDDDTTNMKVGIYINGKLYDDRFILVRDMNPEKFIKKFAYRVYEGEHTFKIKSVKKKVDLSIYGF